MSLVDSEIFDVRLEKRSANDAYGMKVSLARKVWWR
jgi:hypothetical protein